MADYAPNLSASLETREDGGTAPPDIVRFWLTQLKIVEKSDKDWIHAGRKIVNRYRDKRGQRDMNLKRFNVLWANTQTLLPALYGRTPKPEVSRRFRDKDPTGRLAADILERAISYALEDHDFDSAMTCAVEDRLLPGRGVIRVRYVPTFGDNLRERALLEPTSEDEAAATGVSYRFADTKENLPADEHDSVQQDETGAYAERNVKDEDGKDVRELLHEQAIAEYWFWEDVRIGPCRQWKDCPWVGFRSYMTRDQLIERFGEKIGKAVTLDYTPAGLEDDKKKGDPPDAFKKATVWEIWDKGKKQVVWVASAHEAEPLDTIDDPLRLKGFLPMPKPLYATTTTDKQEPVADYVEYQDQAEELDVLTARIDRLVRACRLAGVYAASERSTLQQLVDEASENKLIPVPDWQTFAQSKGGLANVIQWLPIKDIAAVLMVLYDARDKVKQSLYEVTGIADILRGATSPVETFGAQELKSQYATLRLSDHQKDVGIFARDTIRLIGEVIAVHFSPDTLSKMTGIPELPDQPKLPPLPQLTPLDPSIAQRAMTGDQQAQAIAQQYQQQTQQVQQQAAQQQQIMQQWQQAVAEKQAQFAAACELLRQQEPHPYRIEIEADSTITPDENAEKQSRVEFLTAIVTLLEQVIPLVMTQPHLAGMAKEMVLYAVRSFRAGRSLEEAFSNAFDDMAAQPPQPPPGKEGPQGKQENPAVQMQANAIEEVKVRGELALKQQKQQADILLKRIELALQAKAIDQKAADVALAHTREMRKILFEETKPPEISVAE